MKKLCLLALVILSSSIMGATLDEGDEAAKREDYATAAKIFLELANKGNALGQGKLGRLYFQGKGVPQNFAEAYFWLSLASSLDLKWVSERENSFKQLSQTKIEEVQERCTKWWKNREMANHVQAEKWPIIDEGLKFQAKTEIFDSKTFRKIYYKWTAAIRGPGHTIINAVFFSPEVRRTYMDAELQRKIKRDCILPFLIRITYLRHDFDTRISSITLCDAEGRKLTPIHISPNLTFDILPKFGVIEGLVVFRSPNQGRSWSYPDGLFHLTLVTRFNYSPLPGQRFPLANELDYQFSYTPAGASNKTSWGSTVGGNIEDIVESVFAIVRLLSKLL